MSNNKTPRKILFRGKAIEESMTYQVGDWVYGYYTYNQYDKIHIIENEKDRFPVIVDPSTVGQLMATNGRRKFFEGDILKSDLGGEVSIWIENDGYFMGCQKSNWEKPFNLGILCATYRKVGTIHDKK